MQRRSLLAGGLGLAATTALSGCSPPLAPVPTASSSPLPTGTSPAPAPPSTQPAGDTYRAVDGYLYDTDGKLFVPLGANVGTTASFDWKGDAQGHAKDALAWGWNAVRLNLMVTGSYEWSYVAQNSQSALLELTARIVDEYTAAGIVVIIAAHDNPRAKGLREQAVTTSIVQWWQRAAAAFADNPRVWCDLINEPPYTNDDWVTILDTLASAVRSTGNANPILIGAPCWGQDVGYTEPYFPDAKFSYEPTMAPALAKRYDNLILEQHNYGAYGLYSTAPKLATYVERVRDAGLAPLIGEFGYTIDKSRGAGGYQANHDGAIAVFDTAPELAVGAIWWHGTHGDKFSLKASGGAFWDGRPRAGLSDGGRRLWALGHPHG